MRPLLPLCLKCVAWSLQPIWLTTHCFQHGFAKPSWAFAHGDAGLAESLELRFRCSLAASDDGTCMAHPLTGRGCGTRDKTNHGFGGLGLAIELRRLFFRRPADFTDHDDALGFIVGQEQLQAINEVGAVDRIAANANASRLAKASCGCLRHSFISQRARAGDNANDAGACECDRA